MQGETEVGTEGGKAISIGIRRRVFLSRTARSLPLLTTQLHSLKDWCRCTVQFCPRQHIRVCRSTLKGQRTQWCSTYQQTTASDNRFPPRHRKWEAGLEVEREGQEVGGCWGEDSKAEAVGFEVEPLATAESWVVESRGRVVV